jgi:hypothetical protein
MSNIWDEMREAVSKSKSTLNAADHVAESMGRLLMGRLRLVVSWTLVQLKRELTKFDAQKMEWKE